MGGGGGGLSRSRRRAGGSGGGGSLAIAGAAVWRRQWGSTETALALMPLWLLDGKEVDGRTVMSRLSNRDRPEPPGFATIRTVQARRHGVSASAFRALGWWQLELLLSPAEAAPTDHSVHQQIAAAGVRNMAMGNNSAANETGASDMHHNAITCPGHIRTSREGRSLQTKQNRARKRSRSREADQLKFAQQCSTPR